MFEYNKQEGVSCSVFQDRSIVWFGVIFVLYFGSEFLIWASRYYMPQVTVNGHSGSIYGRPHIVGEWAIFGTGVNFLPFPMPFRLGTLVVPRKHLMRAGPNIVGLTHVSKCDVHELPEKVYDYCTKNKGEFNINNVYFGSYTEYFIKLHEHLPNYLVEIKKLNRRINTLADLFEGKYDSMTEIVNLGEKFGGKQKIFDFDRLKGEKKDEE